MARRRRRRVGRQKPPNLWVIVFQILILVGLLVAILSVTDIIGDGTSVIFDSLVSEDLAVEDEEEVHEFPGEKTMDVPHDAEVSEGPSDRTDAGLDHSGDIGVDTAADGGADNSRDAIEDGSHD